MADGIGGAAPSGGVSGLCCVWFLVAALNSGFCVRLLRAASTRLLRAASTRGFFGRLLHCVEFPLTHALGTRNSGWGVGTFVTGRTAKTGQGKEENGDGRKH